MFCYRLIFVSLILVHLSIEKQVYSKGLTSTISSYGPANYSSILNSFKGLGNQKISNNSTVPAGFILNNGRQVKRYIFRNVTRNNSSIYNQIKSHQDLDYNSYPAPSGNSDYPGYPYPEPYPGSDVYPGPGYDTDYNYDTGPDWNYNPNPSPDHGNKPEYNPSPDSGSNLGDCNLKNCPRCGFAPLNKMSSDYSRKEVGYIVNGETEDYGEWPSVAVLSNWQRHSSCVGVLISNRHVLTAGHCVENGGRPGSPDYFSVTLAKHSRALKDSHEFTSEVYQICLARKFTLSPSPQYDFAILTLTRPVPFNQHIQPACLPTGRNEYNRESCFAVGMGVTKKTYFSAELADFMQKLQVEKVPCPSYFNIPPNDVSRHCWTKYGSGGDTCAGDSGGPILCLSNQGQWTVQALVSFGSSLCDGTQAPGWTAVYANVPSLINEIKTVCDY